MALLLVAGAAWADDGGLAEGRDPEAPRVGASLDRIDAQVGDRLTLTVSAIARGAIAQAVRLPARLDLGKFEVLDSTASDRDLGDGNRARRFVLQIAAYEVGDLELPAIPLEYTDGAGRRRTVETGALTVHVRSVLGDDPEAQPQPLRPPRDVLVEDRRFYTAARWGGVLAGVLAAWWIGGTIARRRRARPRIVVAPPPRPAAEIALERIEALRRRGGFSIDEYRPFWFELAEILRAYLGARFGFDSLELTTTELRTELGRVDDPLLALHRLSVDEFLDRSDLVKFAKASSSDEEALAGLDAVEAIVLGTRVVATQNKVSSPEAAHG